MRLLAATSDHYDAMIRLAAERNPTMGPEDIGWQLMVPQSWPDLQTLRALDADGELLGWGWIATGTHAPEGWTSIWVTVRHEAEGQGVGGELFRSLSGRRPASAVQLRSHVRSGEDRALEIAGAWGFEEEEVAIASELPLTDLPPVEIPAGVSLESCPALTFEDQDAVEAMLQASQTNPEALAGAVVDCANLLSTTVGGTSIAVLARVDGVPAAIAAGTSVDGFLFVSYTGVDPAHRGRGLARLVKQQAHLDAAADGAEVSRTENEQHNAGIRRVNQELGYRVLHGTHRLRLPLTR